MTQTGGRYPGWRPGIELRDDWLGLVPETAIDPQREIVDPHHHLWRHGTPDAPAGGSEAVAPAKEITRGRMEG